MVDEKPKKESDITVYGATSFVARHVLNYFRLVSISLDRDIRITLGGRNKSKLSALKEELATLMENLDTISPDATGYKCVYDYFEADGGDLEALKEMAKRTEIVLSCAGPFAQYGSNVVAACAEMGTDYVDITGEVRWAGEMRETYGAAAAESGARIISFCGFDSVPSDLAVFAAFKALKQADKQAKVERATTWHHCVGLPGGGTVLTALGMPVSVKRMIRRPIPFFLEDPLILASPSAKADPKAEEIRNRLAKAEWLNQLLNFDSLFRMGVSIPFFMAPVNTKVVHSSALAWGYGDNFIYRERHVPTGFKMTLNLGALALVPAIMMQVFMLVAIILLKTPVLGTILVNSFFKPGTGMSDRTCKVSFAEVFAQLETPPNKDGKVDKADVLLRFEGDPGNWVTAQCVCESALCLLLNRVELPPISEDGFGSPAELLGSPLLKRLQKSTVRPMHVESYVRKNVDRWEWNVYTINIHKTK